MAFPQKPQSQKPLRFWLRGWTRLQAKEKERWHKLWRDRDAQIICGHKRDEIARRVVYSLDRLLRRVTPTQTPE